MRVENEGEGGNVGFQRERDHSFGVRLKKGRTRSRGKHFIFNSFILFMTDE